MNAVINFFQDALNVSIDASEISAAHRLSSPTSRRITNLNQRSVALPAPIIVKFVRRQVRDNIFANRKMLKTTKPGVYLNEHLSPRNAEIFAKARSLLKLTHSWGLFIQRKC